jgi:hypothetical protein
MHGVERVQARERVNTVCRTNVRRRARPVFQHRSGFFVASKTYIRPFWSVKPKVAKNEIESQSLE